METDRPAPREPFGRLLKRLRLTAGLSQEDLAERAGVSWRTISDLERGVKQAPRPSTLRLLADVLALSPPERAAVQPRALLLLLDNCEHLIAACAELAEALLRACPRLTIVATSREALDIGGERPWRVPSLRLPDPRGRLSAEQTLASEAVQLFVQRAQVVRPAFAPQGVQVGLVAQVCRRLDGIPLAVELAAARLAALSLEQLAARLEDRLSLLRGGSRTALPHRAGLQALGALLDKGGCAACLEGLAMVTVASGQPQRRDNLLC